MKTFLVENSSNQSEIKSLGIYLANEEVAFDAPEKLRCIDFDKHECKGIFSFAIIYFDSCKETCDLVWIGTNPIHQHMGYATHLLQIIFKYAKNMKCKFLYLDDATDAKPPKNIYFKLGFQIQRKGRWRAWRETDDDLDEVRRKQI